MCGRSALTLDKNHVQCACSYKPKGSNKFIKPEWVPEHNDGKEYEPSYNIAPTDVTPVLVSSSKFKNGTNDRILKPMMWGIIPPWHKGDYKSHNLSTNNCRLENINGSKLYNPILKEGGRCVIVVEGFYEWQTVNKSTKGKQPYFIYSPQNDNIKIDKMETWNNKYDECEGWTGINLLHMAGLYHVWQQEETIIYSYSIITMDSNDTFNWLHHRMPAILNTQEQIQAWLDVDNVKPEIAISYLKPINIISWHPVSTVVNNSRNKSQECNKEISITKKLSSQRTLNSWFTKKEKRRSPTVESESKRFKK